MVSLCYGRSIKYHNAKEESAKPRKTRVVDIRTAKANFKWFRLHLVVDALYHKAPLSFSKNFGNGLGQRVGKFLVESNSLALINHCV